MDLYLTLSIIISVIIGYLIGSLNSSITVVKIWKKVDIRDYGSKNAGLTNTLRVFGKGPALATLISDLLKGVIAVFIGRLIAHFFGIDNTLIVGYCAGISAFLGHIFPLYYGFKGGKGVLMAATTLLALDPLTFVIVIPFFALILYLTRYVSLSSILAAIAYPIITYITQLMRDFDTPLLDAGFALVMSIIMIYMHKANIQRLKNGTENKFTFKRKQEM